MDPCLYILRFSSQLQFGEKSHEVSMTALRLVQRMKRDSIHSGRRPSGICGAALLIAARLHEFNRTPADVVRIVKVHESTLRKRLLEFGDTPSSALTLEEFMTVDLEEEQDPPAFRAARKRDKERLQKLMEEEDGEKELTELQKEIEHQLEKDGNKRKKVAAVIGTSTNVLGIDEATSEDVEASRFAAEDALDLIGEIANDVTTKEDAVGSKSEKMKHEKGLGPDLAVIGLGSSQEDKSDKFVRPEPKQAAKDLHNADELVLDQKDEEYINSLIMSDEEMKHKALLWNKINAGYLKDQKIKEEMRAKEREENKDKKKKLRGSYKKRTPCNAATAGEAIEKMIAEKKISSKINYDILKSLDHPGTPVPPTPKGTTVDSKPTTPAVVPESPVQRKRKRKIQPNLSPRAPATPAPPTPQPVVDIAEDYDDEMEADPVDVGGELSLAAMLQNGQEDDYYGYEEY
ncbi:hypothetical protein HW555_007741 [Spodoptera exigua]|uniref:Cyclin-like domain-containing protein n=1 Tax=Spodoptera exigua TaxID=7107 RepID=A0A835L2E8_SPOEX|nr:hypothetical protein HW555_007741 [Spodoptera exigua]